MGSGISGGNATAPNSRISNANSSSATLADAAIFVGTGERVEQFSSVVVTVFTDQPGKLFMEQSTDGVTWQFSRPFNVAANKSENQRQTITHLFYRTRFENNSGSGQSNFAIQTFFGRKQLLSSPLNAEMQQDEDSTVVKSVPIETLIAEGLVEGHTLVQKFAHNEEVDTNLSHIWSKGGILNFPTTEQTLEVLSDDGGDTSAGAGARQVTITGLDGNFLEVSEVVTMNGTSTVAVVQAFLRINKMEVTSRGTYNDTNIGTITAQISGGGDVLGQIPLDPDDNGIGKSEGSHHTIPAGKQGHLRNITINIQNTKLINVNMRIRTQADDITAPFLGTRNSIQRFQSLAFLTAIPLKFPLIIPEKSDLWFEGVVDTGQAGFVSVDYELVLVDIPS